MVGWARRGGSFNSASVPQQSASLAHGVVNRLRAPCSTQCLSWVKTGKAQIEHMFSGLPPKAPAAMESAALTPPVRPRAQGADAFLRGEPRCHF